MGKFLTAFSTKAAMARKVITILSSAAMTLGFLKTADVAGLIQGFDGVTGAIVLGAGAIGTLASVVASVKASTNAKAAVAAK
jgi:hypothetical protein